MTTLIIVPRYVALLKNYASKPKITKWLKEHGQLVKEHEPLVIVETTKTSLEIEAPASGLVFIMKNVTERVKIGDTLGVIVSDQAAFNTLVKEPLRPEDFL